MKHYSVLKKEVIDGLNINPDGIYVDATLGYGGHSKEVLKRLRRGFLFAFDQDEDATSYSEKVLSNISNNFKDLNSLLEELIDSKVQLRRFNRKLLDSEWCYSLDKHAQDIIDSIYKD